MYEFIVETGEGIPDATSYATVEQADQFAEFWGYSDWEELDLAQKEFLLIRSTRFIDEQFTWRSNILTKEQGLLFPRHPFLDNNGRKVEGVPKDIIEAVAEIAILLEQHDEADLDQVKALTSQSYGNTSETYSGTWYEGITPFVAAVQKIAARLKHLGLGGNTLKQVKLRRG